MGAVCSKRKVEKAVRLEDNDAYVRYFSLDSKLIEHRPYLQNIEEDVKIVGKYDTHVFNPGEDAYLISAQWLDCWLDYDRKQRGKMSNPGPIDNKSLEKDGYLQPHARGNIDYRVLCKDQWQFLFERWGGGPVLYFIVPSGFPDESYRCDSFIQHVKHNWVYALHPSSTKEAKMKIIPRPPLSTSEAPSANTYANTSDTASVREREIVDTLQRAVIDNKIQEDKRELAEGNASGAVGYIKRESGQHRMHDIIAEEAKNPMLNRIFGNQHRNDEKKEMAACLMLQGAWRIKKAAKHAEGLRRAKEALEKERREKIKVGAAVSLQSQWRKHHAGHVFESLKVTKATNDASVTITKVFRGYQARKVVRGIQMASLQCVKLFIQKAYSLNVGDGMTASADPYVIISTMSDPQSLCDASLFARSSGSSIHKRGSSTRKNSTSDGDNHDDDYDYNASNDKLNTIALSRTSCKSNTLAPEWDEEIILSSLTLPSYITLTIVDKDVISLNGADFLGQNTFHIADYPELYQRDNEVVFKNVPVGNFRHRLYDDRGKEVKMRGKQMAGKGYISFKASMPPLYVNMSGWLQLKSHGLIHRDYKRKWIVLSGDTLWHFDNPWSMENVKGKIKTCNITDIIEEDGYVDAWSIRFYDSEITSNLNSVGETGEQSVWELKWDPENSVKERETWRRRLKAASTTIFCRWLDESGIKYRKAGQIAARAIKSSVASLNHGVAKNAQKPKRSIFKKVETRLEHIMYSNDGDQ